MGKRSKLRQRVVPQSAQKCRQTCLPLPPERRWNTFGAAPVKLTSVLRKIGSTRKAVPVKRWQKLQWQMVVCSGWPLAR